MKKIELLEIRHIEQVNEIIDDTIHRLKFNPAMYEVRTKEVFRIDAINFNNSTFHICDGAEYDWFSFDKFVPVLIPMSMFRVSYDTNGATRAAFYMARDICLASGFTFSQNLEFLKLEDVSPEKNLSINTVLDVIEILNYKFVDYRNLIDRGLAVDVTALKNNPYAKKR